MTRLPPALPVADTVAIDVEIQETATADSEIGTVLDEQEHDSDVAGLVDRPNADENDQRQRVTPGNDGGSTSDRFPRPRA